MSVLLLIVMDHAAKRERVRERGGERERVRERVRE